MVRLKFKKQSQLGSELFKADIRTYVASSMIADELMLAHRRGQVDSSSNSAMSPRSTKEGLFFMRATQSPV